MHKFEPLTAVVLVDNNMGIGSGSDILFHCRPFREQQMRILANYPVIMGRTAYESFPWEKVPAMWCSRILLLSSTAKPDGRAEIFRSVSELIDAGPRRTMVFGGECTFKALLPYCSTIMACQADIELPADRRFPVALGKNKCWKVCERSKVLQGPHKLDVPCQFVTYARDIRVEPVRWPDGRANQLPTCG